MAIKYKSSDKVISGVPLGGVGCGTMQVFPDGTRGLFTGLNNWEKPLGQLHWFRAGSGGDYRVCNPFAIYVKSKTRKIAKFLQTRTLDDCPTVKRIDFEGSFPFARLNFKDDLFGLEATLLAFSPFIKEDYKNSSLPCVIYKFIVKNTKKTDLEAAIMGAAFNPVGHWNVGRFNEVFKKGNISGVNFLKDNNLPHDGANGSITFATDSRDKITYLGEWNLVRENFRGNQDDRNFEAWKYFRENGELPGTNTKIRTVGEGDEWMSAISVKFNIEKGGEKEVNFYYAWHMPNHYLGHMYENWFRDSLDVARYTAKNHQVLFDRTRSCLDVLQDAPVQDWLKDGMTNSLSVINAASWWTKDNAFVMYENPVKWPLMDSLDVRYYGTMPLLMYFPQFEKNTLRLFKKMQRPDGRIPHDLGKSQINCPSDGTTAGKPWKDLSTKYALMVYRNYLWTKDPRNLREMYFSVKRAMEWEFETDKDGNGLPDNEGKDQTYDLWDFYGTSSYTSGIFLASLKACMKMALVMRDNKFYSKCEDYFERGRKSFEEELWTGSYYIAGKSKDKTYNACIASQLNGQWYAHVLGLGYLFDRQRVKKAVRTIIKLNGSVSDYGVVNSVFPDGKIDRSSYHAENIWVGESYAFCSLAIYEGYKKQGLELAYKTWSNFANLKKNVWYQPDVIFAKDGAMGDGELYIRNLSLWTIVFALARSDKKIKRFLLKLEPKLPL